jgi:hypothetical protein
MIREWVVGKGVKRRGQRHDDGRVWMCCGGSGGCSGYANQGVKLAFAAGML